MTERLPQEIETVFQQFLTCELTTINKRGYPVTMPVSTHFDEEKYQFTITTSIAFPQKVYNMKRNPKVSMLFSNPTGCGMDNPPAVLVQGEAVVSDKVSTSVFELREYWRDSIIARQPASIIYSWGALSRYLSDWYYMRLHIYVTPKQVMWWRWGDFSREPEKMRL